MDRDSAYWDQMRAELLALKSKELKAIAKAEGAGYSKTKAEIVSAIIIARRARELGRPTYRGNTHPYGHSSASFSGRRKAHEGA